MGHELDVRQRKNKEERRVMADGDRTQDRGWAGELDQETGDSSMGFCRKRGCWGQS